MVRQLESFYGGTRKVLQVENPKGVNQGLSDIGGPTRGVSLWGSPLGFTLDAHK